MLKLVGKKILTILQYFFLFIWTYDPNPRNTLVRNCIKSSPPPFHYKMTDTYTEQKWKCYTTIIYILLESIWQKVFTKV